jgi:methyl halide transferase
MQQSRRILYSVENKTLKMQNLNAEYWSNRYVEGRSQWDVGSITPPLKEYVDQLTNKNVSILIPGCGTNHEAAYLLAQGFTNITVIDISPVLCQKVLQNFEQFLGKELMVVCGNFFSLQGQFDLIIEQTFFCALDISLRKNYVQKMKELIKPGGKLVGLLFNKYFESDEPPFGGDLVEYETLFSPHFMHLQFSQCYNSVEKRMGNEFFFFAKND